MRTMCSREIFTKKCRQQPIFDSDLKGAWHYNHVSFTPIAKNFMLYCRLISMLSILCVRLTIKVKVGIPESFKVGWYPPKKTGSSHLKSLMNKILVRWLEVRLRLGPSPTNARVTYSITRCDFLLFWKQHFRKCTFKIACSQTLYFLFRDRGEGYVENEY